MAQIPGSHRLQDASIFFKFKPMKVALQYLSDAQGNTHSVQLSLTDWKKVLTQLKKYEEALKFKKDLKEALDEVEVLKNLPNKPTLKDLLDEL